METALLGLSEADITPAVPVQTVGFRREDELSRGVSHSLSAQVSVWQLALEKCCLVTIDHIGFSTQHADMLRHKIGRMLSISKDKVMLCFSHTHSAPNDSIETAYADFADTRIKEAVREAVGNMSPVKASWGNAYGDIGVNRRGDCSALDSRIGILKVVDADSGNLRLLLLRLTAHANVLKEDNYQISPDYFGAVRDLLAEKYPCVIMLTQGASGNISPRYYTTSRVWTTDNPAPSYYGKCESATALSDMAEEVYRQTDRVIDEITPRDVKHLDMYSIYQKLDADVPIYERAMEIA
ncbi:MAG: hypothetical protein VB064_06695 [Oscillospiraceae bacterium]|nr:hypothetical protein [Oscillospiraceae bacterium]